MSRYENASRILPPDLLAEVQRHAAGRQLYVPRPAARARWGEHTGARERLRCRNDEIRRLHREGTGMDELMDRFHLGYDSLKKIVGGKNGLSGSLGESLGPPGLMMVARTGRNAKWSRKGVVPLSSTAVAIPGRP